MNFSEIDLKQTHIRLRTDLPNHNLNEYIIYIRNELENYLLKDQDFLLALEPIKRDGNLPLIVKTMVESSNIADVGPMACVAGTISEMSLDYLIANDSRYSIIENGGDIAMINDEEVLCGIYSNNEVLGNDIAFKIKSRKRPLGICTSSGKIGHSISFGTSDSVTVISKSASIADGLATRIANDVEGPTGEDKVSNALESADEYKEFFTGVLIVSDDYVGTSGSLPKIVETSKFDFKKM